MVSADVHTDGKFRGANSVLKYREQYCDGSTVKKDVAFKSASTAANFITDRSTNGLITWKTSDGTVVRVVDLRQLVVAYVGRISLKREPQVNKPAVRALNYYLYKNFRHSTHTGI